MPLHAGDTAGEEEAPQIGSKRSPPGGMSPWPLLLDPAIDG
jgi:hypothetical protein